MIACTIYSISTSGITLINVFVQAYKQGIIYPRYLFLFYGWYSDQWWIGSEDDNISCTTEQMETVIGPALAPIQDEFISNCSRSTSTGIVSFFVLGQARRSKVVYTTKTTVCLIVHCGHGM